MRLMLSAHASVDKSTSSGMFFVFSFFKSMAMVPGSYLESGERHRTRAMPFLFLNITANGEVLRLHKETLMTVDSAVVTVYANFFGTAQFGNKTIDAKQSGSGLQISYDKKTGEAKDLRFVTSLPAVLSDSNDK